MGSTVDITMPQDVLSDVQRWLKLNVSSLLWVEGPIFPSDLSPVALRVSMVTSDTGIPCVSFFDKRRYFFAKLKKYKEAGLISLLYSLIIQLVNLLPPQFETDLDFDEKRFSELDGTLSSVEQALGIIQELLSLAPASIVCIVDGIQAFECRETRKHMQRLVDILRDRGSETVVKALFTTDGMSHALAAKLNGRGERVIVSEMIPGRPSRGGSTLNDLASRSRGRPRSVPPSRKDEKQRVI
jgi:hypothetical protein